MNKPIIVDGVDVSECPNYSEKNDTGEWCDLTCTKENAPYFRCESMPNCLFKQFQRLKEENEILYKELQYKYEEMDAKGFLLMGEDLNFWKNLKAENEKLKKEVSDLNFYINSYRQVWEIDKYRKALEEIKAIAELEVVIFDNKPLFPTNIQRIIDKINEVLK